MIFKKKATTLKAKLFKECLCDAKKILDRINQNFFLAAGTLLGQQRDNSFIPHDNDIDIGILSAEFSPATIEAFIKSEKFNEFKELGEDNKSKEFSFRHRNGIKIDFFLHYPVNTNNDNDYYYYASFHGLCNDKPEGYCKWGRHIRGFRQVKFAGRAYSIPNNAEQYLEEEYGPDWRTPKQFNYFEGLDGEYKNMIN